MTTETLETPTAIDEYIGSITFLNMTGDITLTYDERNREKVLEVIRKKMAEGYTFFTTKKFLFKKLTRKVKITEKNIEQVEEIVITDAQFEKMCDDMNDKDIATLVRNDNAKVVKRTKKEVMSGVIRAKRAEDVVAKDALAIRPLVGG